MSVRGYASWKPKPEAVHWIRATNEVIEQYRDYWPLSVRQLFYRLVADHSYEKSEAAYGRLTQIISRSRRAGFIEWDAVRDGGLGRAVPARYFDDGQDFERSVEAAAKSMKLNRQRDQEMVIELWCEAGGMVPILEGIARPYSAQVNTGGGYDSVTAKHRLAERVRDRADRSLRTIILHVGDFDGSGEDMANVLRDDTMHMAASQILNHGEGGPDWLMEERGAEKESWSKEAIRWALDHFAVERVALTAEQVVERQVETAPPKRSDSRSPEFIRRNEWVVEELGTEHITAQLEALTPPELEEVIRGAIEQHLDMDVYEQVIEDEKQVRADLLKRLKR